ncbi:MAG: STAS domain-containing protein [Candidatus Baltobacteraceae bacterium]|jgi:anti-anti-sigma factor
MPSDTLTIDVTPKEEGRVALFSLRGSLDIATAPSLRAALLEAAERDGHEIVVDLSHLEFLDSSGLGALIGAHKLAEEHQGSVRLVAQEGQILRLLRITGLLEVLNVYSSVDAAIAGDARLVGF